MSNENVYIKGNYSTIKKNKINKYAGKQMKLEIIRVG